MNDAEKSREELLEEVSRLRQRVADLEVSESARKQTEQELVRLERLRAVEEMAQGVAHNFNNLLVGVLGYAQLIQMKTAEADIQSDAERIVESALRAKGLVERLNRSLRGDKKEAIQAVSVAQTVEEVVEAASPRWRDEAEAKGIAIEMATDVGEVPSVRATQGGLYDILINLLFNAVDALPQGGRISIGARVSGQNVELSVRDTGVGMDEATLRRVFEPFFTTKADVGTGLGLSTVYGIVTRWGGSVEVESTPKKGTCFTVRIPVWTASEVKESPEAGYPPGGDSGERPAIQGRLMVVEDDPMVTQFLFSLLSREHEVETFSDGEQALSRFAPGRYDVALIDLGMPGIPGDQVALNLREVDPLVATVLITGWEVHVEDPRMAAFDFRLQKPFTFLDKVRQVVSQALVLHQAREQEGAG